MKKLIVCISFLTCLPAVVFSSHLRCGYISVEAISETSRNYRITVTVYTDIGSTVLFGGSQDILDFGDGTRILVPETTNTPIPGFSGVGIATASFLHTFPGPGRYTISYLEPNRNANIINIINSVNTLFYLETSVDLSSPLRSSTTPHFLANPIFFAELGKTFSECIGGVSPDDNLLYYELINPLERLGIPINNYWFPENLSLNPYTGLLTWDTKIQGEYITGEYLFSVKIHQYKQIDGVLYSVGYMIRDIQVILQAGNSGGRIFDQAELDEYERFYLAAGEGKQFKIYFEADNATSLEQNVFSELQGINDVFSFSTYDSSHLGTQIKVSVLTVHATEAIRRSNPYLITIRGTLQNNGKYSLDKSYLFYTEEIPPTIITEVGDIKEDERSTVEIYPNPVAQYLTIELNEPLTAEVIIYSQDGRTRLTEIINERAQMDLQGLPPGIYLCEVRQGAISIRRIKLIKN